MNEQKKIVSASERKEENLIDPLSLPHNKYLSNKIISRF